MKNLQTVSGSELEKEYKKLAVFSKHSVKEVKLMQETVAKGTTMMEFALFLQIAKGAELNPFLKEIWCIKYGGGEVLIFTSRDGWRKLAHRSPNFIALNSMEVREDDEFEMGIENGSPKIFKHKFAPSVERTNKKILGAYAIVDVKGDKQVVEWADFRRYEKSNVWKSHPEEMIKKVAEVHAIKKVANASGLYCEEEINQGAEKNLAVPLNRIKAGNQKRDELRKKKSVKAAEVKTTPEPSTDCKVCGAPVGAEHDKDCKNSKA